MIARCSLVFFFFSSRRRHTRLVSDWSSDVCSSDLATGSRPSKSSERMARRGESNGEIGEGRGSSCRPSSGSLSRPGFRSEERRVGKSVDLGGRRRIKKKKKKSGDGKWRDLRARGTL